MLAILDASALYPVEKVRFKNSVPDLIPLLGKTGPEQQHTVCDQGLGASSRLQKRRRLIANVRELLNIVRLH